MTETAEAKQDWTEEQYGQLYGHAETIARSVHRSYPMVDTDDLLQEALMWAVEHPGVLRGYLSDEDQQRGARMTMGAMKNACRAYAVRSRALQRGDDSFIDDAWYQLAVLKGTGKTAGKRGLLHHVFDDQSWISPEKPEGEVRRSGADPAEGNNWLAMLSDVSSAVGRLCEADRELITAHYKNAATYEEIGLMLEPQVSRETVSKRMDRAIKKVQEILGGPKPRQDPAEEGWDQEIVGTRRAVSNATARAMTGQDYEQ